MIRRFLLLNGIAIASAVVYHASGWGFIAMFWWTHRYAPVAVPNFDQMGSVAYFALRLVEQLIIFAVPAFLFVSGFFVAFATGRNKTNVDRKMIAARIRGLVIPYLLWSVLILALSFVQGERHGPLTYLQMLVTGRTSPPYYFIPLIVQLYLLSAILVPLARKNWKLLLVIAAFIQLFVRAIIYLNMLEALPEAARPLMPLTASWFFPGHLFWFTSGIVVGFNLDSAKQFLTQAKTYFLAVAVILFPLGVLEWEWILQTSSEPWIATGETLLDSFYAAAVILAFLGFSNLNIPFSRQLSDWGSKSFGIYLAHAPVLEFGAKAIYALAPWILAYQFLFQPILVSLGLGIPLLLMRLARMEKSPVRLYYQHIFG